jgi:prepilin-type N-terminal cleavage/methylation domain-containing protein
VKLAGIEFTNEKGTSLVELLVALAIIAIVFTALLTALSTASFSVAVVRERVTAENIARAQLEHVQKTGFIAGTDYYTPTVISHPGYGATIAATTIYTGMQLITVTIYHNGPVFTIGSYKVDRQ